MNVQFRKLFLKELDKIRDKRLKDAVFASILNVEQAQNLSQVKNLKKLTGFESHYRIRVGDYRIGVKVEGGVVHFAAFSHRKDIYKRFP